MDHDGVNNASAPSKLEDSGTNTMGHKPLEYHSKEHKQFHARLVRLQCCHLRESLIAYPSCPNCPHDRPSGAKIEHSLVSAFRPAKKHRLIFESSRGSRSVFVILVETQLGLLHLGPTPLPRPPQLLRSRLGQNFWLSSVQLE